MLSGIPDEPGIAAKVFEALATKNISVDMIIQSFARTNKTNDIAFTVTDVDLERTMEILEEVKNMLGASEILIDENIAKVSIVGAGMVDRPGIAANMFKTLADEDINIKMIATSEIKISCLVDKDKAKAAIKALHTAFELDSNVVAEVKGDLPTL